MSKLKEKEMDMKSRKRAIPVRTARNDLVIIPRREPRHPAVGRQPMSLARALTEPVMSVDEVEEVDTERDSVRRRKAA